MMSMLTNFLFFATVATSIVASKDDNNSNNILSILSSSVADNEALEISTLSYTDQLYYHQQERRSRSQRSRLLQEASACEVATSNITANETYSAMRELIDNDLIEIMNHTNPEANVTCTGNSSKVDGFEVCIGNVNPFTIHNLETMCTSIGGQIVQIQNIQVVCNPSSTTTDDETLTKIIYIPECVGAPCDEDFIADYIDDVYKSVAKLATKVNGLPGTCKATEGSDGPVEVVSSAFNFDIQRIPSILSLAMIVLSLSI